MRRGRCFDSWSCLASDSWRSILRMLVQKPQRRGSGLELLMEDEKNSAFLLVLMENCVIITSRCPAETAWGRPADEKAYSGMDGSSVRRCSLLPSCAHILFENEISQNIKRGGRIRGRLFCWLKYSDRGGIEPQGRAISPEHGPAGVPRCAAGGGHAGFSHGFCRSKYRGLPKGAG